jgi:hypothetical protein
MSWCCVGGKNESLLLDYWKNSEILIIGAIEAS